MHARLPKYRIYTYLLSFLTLVYRMSSDEEPQIVKQETCKPACDTTPKPSSKRTCTPEQLERLKLMRIKALQARKDKSEARKEEAKRRVSEVEEIKVTREVKKLAAAKKRPTAKEADSGSDSDGGSPPAAVARNPPSIDVGEKPRRRRKPVKVAVEASSSSDETEIVIRRPSRKGKSRKPSATVTSTDVEPEDLPQATSARMYSEADVAAMMDEKLKTFKQSVDDDAVLKLIRHMMPNYNR